MKNEVIVTRQGISIIVLFIIGSAIVLSPGGSAKQDSWLAMIIAMLVAFVAVAVYSRILIIFPEKDLYGVLQEIFGRKWFGIVISKVMILTYTWYAFHLGAMVFRNFSEFIIIVSMPETPQVLIVAPLGILCIWLVKGGLEILGRWSVFMLPIILVAIMTQYILSMTQADFDNLKPVLYNGIKPVISSAYGVFTFPFAETVIFILIFSSTKRKFNIYKVFNIGILVGGVILLIAMVRNVMVLGIEDAAIEYFPSYEAVSMINIANFVQRIEVIVSTIFIVGGIVKISVCLFAACKGFAHFMSFKNYRAVVVPVGFLMMNLSCFIYLSAEVI